MSYPRRARHPGSARTASAARAACARGRAGKFPGRRRGGRRPGSWRPSAAASAVHGRATITGHRIGVSPCTARTRAGYMTSLYRSPAAANLSQEMRLRPPFRQPGRRIPPDHHCAVTSAGTVPAPGQHDGRGMAKPALRPRRLPPAPARCRSGCCPERLASATGSRHRATATLRSISRVSGEELVAGHLRRVPCSVIGNPESPETGSGWLSGRGRVVRRPSRLGTTGEPSGASVRDR